MDINICEEKGIVKVLAYQRKYSKWNIGRTMYLQKVLLEGGACQFCHVILKDDIFKLSPKPEIGEQMWLDKIARNKNKKCVSWKFIIYSSRLACQIRVIKEMNGTTVFVVILCQDNI
ncbi:2FE-2S ferredoxin [Blastocystis sp. subtype 4]|uniref:2FE-2S ferredoxin n=1 Tax=Blastocystis sp. subtype 4 TaxID=944170 RepID=UPI0007122286|nr:2FE-2S ferredoxin [Blastocystis sp. subtype 4]KNB42234.1 2FE-2S ferredoxin [Blastocystis sp. subtype 4]|eukprot:XP_014525677.1 2FE-2S ferredoxin [Blastocystis sp. subtype 4]